jgi:hypothetical protein
MNGVFDLPERPGLVGSKIMDNDLQKACFQVPIPVNQEFHFLINLAYAVWNNFVVPIETDWISKIKIHCYFDTDDNFSGEKDLKAAIKQGLHFGLEITLAPSISMIPVCFLKLRAYKAQIAFYTRNSPESKVFEISPICQVVDVANIAREINDFLRDLIQEAKERL